MLLRFQTIPLCRLGVGLWLAALLTTGCTNSPTPTSPTVTTPPPVVPDAPKLTCPANQTAASPDGNGVLVSYPSATVANGQTPLTTACTPLTGTSFSVGTTTVTCKTTDALQRTDSCTFTVTVTAPPRLSATSFLAFGDSITWGEDGTVLSSSTQGVSTIGFERLYPRVQLPLPQTYPFALQTLLQARYSTQTITVANAGNPGEAVTYPDTFPRLVRYLATGQYKAILLMEGTNDLYTRDAALLPAVITGLGQMIDASKAAGARPYLATIPPMNPLGYRGAVYGNTLVTPLNNLIKGLATQKGVTLVDINAAITNVNTELAEDGLHPNAAGYAKITQAWFTAIRSTLEVTPTTSASAVLSSFGAGRR